MEPPNGPSSPTSRIFAPTSFVFDDSQLCFNKNHFSRSDFDVQRFMNLTRRRAGLEQIQKDLRMYLKSIQHSMIELINDDYADFVHLSSSLVSLQSSIEKSEQDIQSFWAEFEESTKDAIGTAEIVENRCEQLAANRRIQMNLRDQIGLLSALQRLKTLLRASDHTVLWLEKITSCVVDVSLCYVHCKVEDHSMQHKYYIKVLSELETQLCADGVQSAAGDCSLLPTILSILSLTNSTHALTAALVADFLQDRLIDSEKNSVKMLENVLGGVHRVRDEWSKCLGVRFTGQLRLFLDQTLLTFVQTFIDKCLSMVAVPSDTKTFHDCYVTMIEFVRSWPTAASCRSSLKIIRDKFNIVVYFKLATYKILKQIDADIESEKIQFCDIKHADETYFNYTVSRLIVNAIETVWSDDVYLPTLLDKLWDLTLRLASKHVAWIKTSLSSIFDNRVCVDGFEQWQLLLRLYSDLKSVHSRIFDFALEVIWPKLNDIGIETSLFGQCITRLGRTVISDCGLIMQKIVETSIHSVCSEFDSVADIPKQYRWTKKPLPSTVSSYILSVEAVILKLTSEIEKLQLDDNDAIRQIVIESFSHFVKKSNEVLDSVHATGSSLSRFKRKSNVEGVSDDDKIKTQIYLDVHYCMNFLDKCDYALPGISELLERSRTEHLENNKTSQTLDSSYTVPEEEQFDSKQLEVDESVTSD